jgi:hypothetical protein
MHVTLFLPETHTKMQRTGQEETVKPWKLECCERLVTGVADPIR